MGSIERVAYHEAGHAVACIWFELPVDRVTIIADEERGSLGHVEHDFGDPDALHSEIELLLYEQAPKSEVPKGVDWLDHELLERSFIEKHATVALAGAAAETRWCGRGRDVDWDDESYRSDVVQASQMLSRFSDHDDEFGAYFEYIAERTKSLVARPQFIVGVDALIEALMGRRELSGEEAANLVRAARKQAAS